MVLEPESGDLDRDVDQSMRMFERSQVGPAALISSVVPARVLLVLDGSTQDATSIASAAYLRAVHNVETLVIDGRDANAQQSDPDASGQNLSTVCAQISGSRPIKAVGDEAYERILNTIADHQLDLVIVPSPFGRSFEKVGADSIGTVLDVLLSKCSVPVLVIRRGDQPLADCVGRMMMVVGGESDVELRAASWMFGLAVEKSELSLNLVVEREQFENLRSLVEAMDPAGSLSEQQLSDALAKSHQALHGSMLKTATQKGLRYELIPQAGEVAPPNPLNDSRKHLLVMPLEVDDRFTQGFVHDRIRRSPHPVLVVPGHVAVEA